MKYKILRIVIVFSIPHLIGACTISPYNESDYFSPKRSSLTNDTYKLSKTFARNDEFVVLITKTGDTLSSLAETYLGDASLKWIIEDFNHVTRIVPGIELVIPLKDTNPSGIFANGINTIPILCYHRFGEGHKKMAVSATKFRQQMQYLKDNGYRVIPLVDLVEHLQGKRSLPRKAVVITVDDGYRSTHDIAFPILNELDFTATVFLYTGFLGAPDALTWNQIRTMYGSGVFDFQPHSKTHPNLALTKSDETQIAYQSRIFVEIEQPKSLIHRKLNNTIYSFAYPFGDTNDVVIDALKKKDYSIAATVQPGSNAAFSAPFMLTRTMIYGDDSLSDFKKALGTFEHMILKD